MGKMRVMKTTKNNPKAKHKHSDPRTPVPDSSGRRSVKSLFPTKVSQPRGNAAVLKLTRKQTRHELLSTLEKKCGVRLASPEPRLSLQPVDTPPPGISRWLSMGPASRLVVEEKPEMTLPKHAATLGKPKTKQKFCTPSSNKTTSRRLSSLERTLMYFPQISPPSKQHSVLASTIRSANSSPVLRYTWEVKGRLSDVKAPGMTGLQRALSSH